MLPAILNEESVIPNSRKIRSPTTAKKIRMAVATQQAKAAMRARCCGESFGVMARKAGMSAIGSMMTKRELPARRTYSSKLWLGEFMRTRRQNRFAHAMDDLLVGRANGRQHPAQLGTGPDPLPQSRNKTGRAARVL